jgi:hypothetical protein
VVEKIQPVAEKTFAQDQEGGGLESLNRRLFSLMLKAPAFNMWENPDVSISGGTNALNSLVFLFEITYNEFKLVAKSEPSRLTGPRKGLCPTSLRGLFIHTGWSV